MGLVRIFDVLEVNGVTFHRLPLVAKINSVPEIMASPAILLAHCFYKSGADPDFSLTDGLIQESKYDMIVMGHDHEPYEDVLVGGTQVIRPGSLTRNTSHTYQLHRMPKYLRMEIALDSAFELSKCDIPNALLPKEVFDEAYFGNALDVSAAFLSNMDFLINSFSQPDRGKQLSIRKVLEDLAPPIQVMDYLRHLHSRLELDFI